MPFRKISRLLAGVMVFLSSSARLTTALVRDEQPIAGEIERCDHHLLRGAFDEHLQEPCPPGGGGGGSGGQQPVLCLLELASSGISNELPSACETKSQITIVLADKTRKIFRKRPSSSSDYFYGESDDGSTFLFRFSGGYARIDGLLFDQSKGTVTNFRVGTSGQQIIESKLSKDFPPESEPDFARRALQELSPSSSDTSTTSNIHERAILVNQDDYVQLDVAVLWSKEFECRLVNQPRNCGKPHLNRASFERVEAEVEKAIELTNNAFHNSGVKIRIHLAYLDNNDGAFEIASPHSDDVDKALEYITTQCSWCGLSNTYGLGKLWGADLVHLIIDDTQSTSCGKAQFGPGRDSIHSVSHWECFNDNYSFANLIATNLGCKADRGTLDMCDDATTDNYGYRDPGAKYRTIMAENCVYGQCDINARGACQRRPIFSHPPSPSDTGDSYGTTDQAKGTDNVKQLNGAIEQVAAFSTSRPTPAPTEPLTNSPTPDCSCVSGENGVSLASPETDSKTKSSKIVKVKELKIGDEIKGLNENKEVTYCTVEAVGQFGTGTVYGNFTHDHYVFNAETDMVEVHGMNQPASIQDKFAVLTSCPAGVDESSVAFTAIDGDFCGAFTDTMSWSDYLLLHKGILRIVRGTGGYWFHGSSYEDIGSLSAHAPPLCESMLRCLKDDEDCVDFEAASVRFIDNALTPVARESTYGTFQNIGRHRKLGSVSAMLSGGASVRK